MKLDDRSSGTTGSDPSGTTTSDPSGTTAQAADGSGGVADGSGAPADGSDVAASMETLQSQLRDEQRKNAQLLSEKSNRENAIQELRDEMRRNASTPQAPPTGVDPRMTLIQRQQAVLARYGEDTLEGQTALANIVSLNEAMRSSQTTEFMRQLRLELHKIPAAERDEVEARVLTGQSQSVSEAHEAVKGQKSGSTIEALQRQVAELTARVEGRAPSAPVRTSDVATNGRSVAAATQRKVSMAEYNRITADPHSRQARELLDAIDKGNTEIDYGL